MASRRNANEIARLQSEISNEIGRDGPEIATMVFGEAKDQPDVATVSNQRLDQVYRDAYLRDDRQWLQGEARRDPEQFLKVAERIGVQMPQGSPGMTPPAATTGAFARAAAAPAPPAPSAPGMPPALALPAPVAVPAAGPVLPIAPVSPPVAPPPVILGPNGQPLPPSGY